MPSPAGPVIDQDRDVLALVVLGEIRAGDRALLVVAAANAERVPQAALGEGRIGRGRRDLQDVAFRICFRRRDRGGRAIVAGHERHFFAGEFFADRARLLGIASVVADFDRELLAEYPTGRIDVGDRLVGTILELLAEGCVLAGHRAGDPDGHVLSGRGARQRQPGAERECG
jgi:hypothetical protein